MQSTDLLKKLNAKLLTEIAKLKKKFAKIKNENGRLKNENVKLRQIIEKNARYDAKNVKHKVRIEKLEKNNIDISAKNAELKAKLNSCSVEEEEILKMITTVLQPDAESKKQFASNSVINQPINGATSDNINRQTFS
ncbi:hypothetical protein RhiirC2_772737 [Rhizophagus irregularis]|uniref:Uncharacterized protein n=1 Tax=Rhizophagus irregularis TaxID=588596 RepID=A0A2N1NQS0_9GLOM|nr:hypothetical protein RhiirC2_772737 [Rhizophagus irregularis]